MMISDRDSKGILYVVGTPIGNLSDLSWRAVSILCQVDLIAAEDTRHTRKLLSAYSISNALTSYHQHNEMSKSEILIKRLIAGQSIALVSDAGMPGISDPGQVLIREAIKHEISVVPISGPNAAWLTLSASGFPLAPSIFLGFLPRKSKDKQTLLHKYSNLPVSLILYESPHRLLKTLNLAYDILGERSVVICRELTKKHEEWLRGTLTESIQYYQEQKPRGEYTLVISGAINTSSIDVLEWADMSVIEHVEFYINQGLTSKEAIKKASLDRKLPKREVYRKYHGSN